MGRHHFFLGLVIVTSLMAVACGAADVVSTQTPSPTPTLAPTLTPAAAASTATAATLPPTPTAAALFTPTTAPAPPSAEQGKVLATSNGCFACHSDDGGPGVGPTWRGLFGKEEVLSDGSVVKVDEAYLRESIVDPSATIVKGFPTGFMPESFGSQLSPEQIQDIIEYIKTLE